MDLDPLDHEADVVRLPVQVKVCDVDDDQDGEDGVDNDKDGVDDDHDGEDDDEDGVQGDSYLSLGRCY